MINELVVRGEPSEISMLVDRMKRPSFLPEGWKRDQDLEFRVECMLAIPRGVLCLTWQGGSGLPSASLFLQEQGAGELSLLNIVPKVQKTLTDEEYNGILSKFNQDVLEPNSDGIGITTILIPPLGRLESSLSPEALRRLKSFASNANKSNPHHSDWRRWDQFLVQVHQDDSYLDDSDLALWLASQGWTEQQFARFVEHFRNGQSLLATYDEERPAS